MPEIQQKIISCPRKLHYYDANKYQSCPYCNGSASFSPTIDPFGGNGADWNTPGNTSGNFGPTADPFSGGYGNSTVPNGTVPFGTGNFGATVDPYGNNPGGLGSFTGTQPAQYNERPEKMGKTEFVDQSTPAGAPTPVVGWLVAIEGPCRGTDYRIHTGYNFIGRESGDIRIHGDYTISAEKDSVVTFVPQTSRFYMAHETGKNVLLVNDVPVLGGGIELHDYDVVTIGTTKLIFIRFCGEHFSWSDKEQNHG